MGDILNSVFEALLATAYDHHAGLVKWGGDAVLLLFDEAGHAERAAVAATEMQRVMRAVGRLRTSGGPVRLRMSIGVHTGDLDFLLVGHHNRELIVTGPAATTVARMEEAAGAGEVVLSATSAAAVRASGGKVGAPRGPGWLLDGPPPDVAALPLRPVKVPGRLDLGIALPRALREHLLDGAVDSEHRHVAVAFVGFSGADELATAEDPDALTAAVDHLITASQDAAEANDVTILSTDLERGRREADLHLGGAEEGWRRRGPRRDRGPGGARRGWTTPAARRGGLRAGLRRGLRVGLPPHLLGGRRLREPRGPPHGGRPARTAAGNGGGDGADGRTVPQHARAAVPGEGQAGAGARPAGGGGRHRAGAHGTRLDPARRPRARAAHAARRRRGGAVGHRAGDRPRRTRGDREVSPARGAGRRGQLPGPLGRRRHLRRGHALQAHAALRPPTTRPAPRRRPGGRGQRPPAARRGTSSVSGAVAAARRTGGGRGPPDDRSGRRHRPRRPQGTDGVGPQRAPQGHDPGARGAGLRRRAPHGRRHHRPGAPAASGRPPPSLAGRRQLPSGRSSRRPRNRRAGYGDARARSARA